MIMISNNSTMLLYKFYRLINKVLRSIKKLYNRNFFSKI